MSTADKKTGNEAAAEQQNTTRATTAAENNPLVVNFKNPYLFEGTIYEQVDLTKLEDLTGADLFKANKVFAMEAQYLCSKPETDPKFCYMLASLATDYPLEFFNRLPLREANKVKDAVFNFFQDAD